MKQIGAKDWARLESLLKELGPHKAKIEAAILAAQNTIDALLKDANETREEIRGVLEDWFNEAEAYYDDRSDKWRDGDAGQAYDAWKTNIADAQACFEMDLEIDLPVDILEELDTMERVLEVTDIKQSPEE